MQPPASKLTRTLATAGILLCAAASTAAADDADRMGAIRALYGEGLKVETSGDTISIDWGTLDEATYRRYVKEHYEPALEYWSTELHLKSLIAFTDAYAVREERNAHILVEPYEKLMVCFDLVKNLSDVTHQNRMKDYCSERAIDHVVAPVVAFRGEPVSYTRPRLYHGVQMGDPLYDESVLITVPGPGRVDSYEAQHPVESIVATVRDEAPQALKRKAEVAKWFARDQIKAGKKRIARRDARLAGRKGNILITDVRIDGSDEIKPISRKARPSCDSAYAHLYGPKKRGYYAVTVSTNEMTCKDDIQSSGFTTHWRIGAICRERLRPGENKVEIAISKNINKDTGRRRVRVRATSTGSEITGEKIYSNRVGKRLVTKSITCTR